VYAGVLNVAWDSEEPSKVVRSVTEIFLHEGYDKHKFLNDIAILKVRNMNNFTCYTVSKLN
jgi:hypothetical protein